MLKITGCNGERYLLSKVSVRGVSDPGEFLSGCGVGAIVVADGFGSIQTKEAFDEIERQLCSPDGEIGAVVDGAALLRLRADYLAINSCSETDQDDIDATIEGLYFEIEAVLNSNPVTRLSESVWKQELSR